MLMKFLVQNSRYLSNVIYNEHLLTNFSDLQWLESKSKTLGYHLSQQRCFEEIINTSSKDVSASTALSFALMQIYENLLTFDNKVVCQQCLH